MQSDIAWRENVARFVGGPGGKPLGEEGETGYRPRSPGDWPWSAVGASLRGSALALGSSPPGSRASTASERQAVREKTQSLSAGREENVMSDLSSIVKRTAQSSRSRAPVRRNVSWDPEVSVSSIESIGGPRLREGAEDDVQEASGGGPHVSTIQGVRAEGVTEGERGEDAGEGEKGLGGGGGGDGGGKSSRAQERRFPISSMFFKVPALPATRPGSRGAAAMGAASRGLQQEATVDGGLRGVAAYGVGTLEPQPVCGGWQPAHGGDGPSDEEEVSGGELVDAVLSQVRWGKTASSLLGWREPAQPRVGSVITRRPRIGSDDLLKMASHVQQRRDRHVSEASASGPTRYLPDPKP